MWRCNSVLQRITSINSASRNTFPTRDRGLLLSSCSCSCSRLASITPFLLTSFFSQPVRHASSRNETRAARRARATGETPRKRVGQGSNKLRKVQAITRRLDVNPATARTIIDEERVRHRLLYGDAQTQVRWQTNAMGHMYRGEKPPMQFQQLLRKRLSEKKGLDEDDELPLDLASVTPTRCDGCGANFQSSYPDQAGFIHAKKIQEWVEKYEKLYILEKGEGIKQGIEEIKQGIEEHQHEHDHQYDHQHEHQHDITEVSSQPKDFKTIELIDEMDEERYWQQPGDDQSAGTPIPDMPNTAATNAAISSNDITDTSDATSEAMRVRLLDEDVDQTNRHELHEDEDEDDDVDDDELHDDGSPEPEIDVDDPKLVFEERALRSSTPLNIDIDPITHMPRDPTSLRNKDVSHEIMAGLISPDAVKWISSNALQRAHVRATTLRPLRCYRCHHLLYEGTTGPNVSTVAADDFRSVLKQQFARNEGRSAVVLKIVDLFDFHGSMIEDFRELVGSHHSVILVANKRDLIPRGASDNRLRAWIKAEANAMGLSFAAVQLVSATTGDGIPGMMRKAEELALADTEHGPKDIYVVGTTNVGKSTLINRLISWKYIQTHGQFLPSTHDDKKRMIGGVTTSPLPGTTLGMVAFPLKPRYDGILFDTPGVINPKQLSTQLNYHELKQVLPQKRVHSITHRLSEGETLLLGGLARFSHISGEPAFYTIICSHDVQIHITRTEKCTSPDTAYSYFERTVGRVFRPPENYQRFKALNLLGGDIMPFELNGTTFSEACADIVVPGLGWVAVTCRKPVTVHVQCAGGVIATERDPLMPYEALTTYQRFHNANRRR